MTYELVHWSTGHRDDVFTFRGAPTTGAEIGDTVRRELAAQLAGDNAPYNLVFTTNGIACTTATVIAASLGHRDLDALDADDVERIRQIHLLLAMFNAMQPGVFALSGWDITGMLTLPAEQVAGLLAEGDTRWIHRAAHDLMGVAPEATRSAEGMPRGRSLYGSVPDQLADEASFLRQLAAILAVRKHYGIATSRQVDVPDVSARGLLVLVHELESSGPPRHALTVLNFAGEPVTATVRSEVLVPGSSVTDMFTQEPVGVVDDLHAFTVDHNAHQGHALLVEAPTGRTRD
jgi:trehalose synthase